MTEREHKSAPNSGRPELTKPRPGEGATPRAQDKPPRPLSYATLPPDHTEALYYEGMAAYQRRDWQGALDRFSQLKALQPNRPGLDALLDEVRWFLQLQAAVPGTSGEQGGRTSPTTGRRGAPRPRWQSWGLMIIGIIGVTALILVAFQGRLPWTNAAEREAQELLSRGQARLNVGDYEGAQAAFEQLLAMSPDDPEALLGFSRSQRQQTLAQGYAAAEAAIAEEDWNKAAEELAKILAIDDSYADAQAKADFVALRRRLASLYDDGSRLYDLGRWEDAITQFERIRALDTTYRAEAVTEFLFVCYLNAGQVLIETTDGQVGRVDRAVAYFSSALAIHPRNRPAADARRLGSLYLDAIRALAEDKFAETRAILEVLLAEAPTYANGGAAEQLYALLIDQADTAIRAGDLAGAITLYKDAQNVAVSDQSAAIEGEARALGITPTPTSRPTLVAQATSVSATPTPFVRVRTTSLNVRSGPGTIYPVFDQVQINDSLAVAGRSEDNSWLLVCCVGGRSGWVAASLVEIQGALSAAPIATPPSRPLATATPRALVATPTPQSVCIEGRVRDTGGGQPLAGWLVILQLPDGSTQSRQTGADGDYRFEDLSAGSYTISEQVVTGWRAVSPESSSLVLAPAPVCQLVDFWNEVGSSSGASPDQPTSPPPKPTPPR